MSGGRLERESSRLDLSRWRVWRIYGAFQKENTTNALLARLAHLWPFSEPIHNEHPAPYL